MSGTVRFEGQNYPLNDGETVLDTLLRNGQPIAFSCRSGLCQSCLLQAVDGELPEAAQTGLKPTYRAQGLFLACQCRPAGTLCVRTPENAGIDTKAEIVELSRLNATVLKVRLRPSQTFSCRPGQYLTLLAPGPIARSYSIANDPEMEREIELHVRLLPAGKMSHWLEHQAVPGTQVTVRGPAGSCFYTGDDNRQWPIVLAGTGTGLAPLYGILQDALSNNHRGPIQILHGALRESDLYLQSELTQLAAEHDNLTYSTCVLQSADGAPDASGDIQERVLTVLKSMANDVRLYLCGAPEMVNPLKTRAFLAGVASRNIHADPFLPSVASGN
ncbi:MAG: 2Fe-2S iron-sulfur cluster binding domain-containing protein [Gammaproteobacteria bacterium]|nr:2Fe-2S iron-sulfur cluster binding domain-containing protein [Gammaproteobacteria bacterium]